MPRPMLGSAARTEVLTVRVTPAQKAALITKYGSTNRALLHLVTKDLKEEKK